jgi:uncharacterized membrane protein YjjP (DUF1212 family)
MSEQSLILSKIKFVMLLGKALHRYGASADRIEKAMYLLSSKLGLEADFFSIPTSIYASFKFSDDTEQARMVRLAPGKVNLSKLYHVDQTVDLVIDNHLTISEGTSVIDDIMAQKPLYNDYIVTLSYALISGAIAVFLNGNYLDVLFSALIGLAVGFFAETVKEERLDSITEGVNAFGVTLTSQFLASYFPTTNSNIIVLSSLINLVPGLMLTMSIGELASQNLTSGTARLMGSLIILMKISFGVFIASQLGNHYNLRSTDAELIHHTLPIIFVMLFIVAIGLAIAFQARKKDFGWIVLAASLSYFSSMIFTKYTGDIAGPFLAGSLIAAASNLFSRLKNRPAMIFLLPAIILLVPGSIGFKGVSLLFQKDLLAGMDNIFRMAITGIALVTGTYFGSIIIKPRRTL